MTSPLALARMRRIACEGQDDLAYHAPLRDRQAHQRIHQLLVAVGACTRPAARLPGRCRPFDTETKVLRRLPQPFSQHENLVVARHRLAEQPSSNAVQRHGLAPITRVELTLQHRRTGLVTGPLHGLLEALRKTLDVIHGAVDYAPTTACNKEFSQLI